MDLDRLYQRLRPWLFHLDAEQAHGLALLGARGARALGIGGTGGLGSDS